MSSKKAKSPDVSVNTLMLAYLCISDIKSLNERVSILDRFGLPDADVATVCGVAEQSVRNARQKNRKLTKLTRKKAGIKE